MMKPFNQFTHMYPPRTRSRIPFNGPVTKVWQKFSDSIAQYKMNGVNTQVVVFPDRHIELWSRHMITEENGGKVKNFNLSFQHRDAILDFTPKDKFSIYNAELLDSRTTNVKNTFYFFDVLVYDGMHLIGKNYAYRHALIWEKLNGITMPIDSPSISNGFYVAQNLPHSEWNNAWANALKSKYVEGLILKRLGSTSNLQPPLRQINNDGFMARCRKPNKNFQY